MEPLTLLETLRARGADVRACKEGRGLEEEKRGGGKRFWYLPKLLKVAEVAKQTLFSKDTRETRVFPRIQLQNTPCFATPATISPENGENGLEEVEI